MDQAVCVIYTPDSRPSPPGDRWRTSTSFSRILALGQAEGNIHESPSSVARRSEAPREWLRLVKAPAVSAARALTYASPLILSRRERMVSETWKLIAERGVEGLTVRELCERCSVSQGTFYNAFATKENVIAIAVSEFAATVVGSHHVHNIDTLEGRLERMVRVQTNILGNKRYIAAVMRVFWSDSPSAKTTKATIVDVSMLSIVPLVRALHKRHGLLPHVSPDRLAESLMVAHYGLLSYWTSGAFADDELVERVVDDDLLLLAGTTRGVAAREVRDWREEIASDGPRWREMKQLGVAEAVSLHIG
jgi:AcrR family transcriptional regulator